MVTCALVAFAATGAVPVATIVALEERTQYVLAAAGLLSVAVAITRSSPPTATDEPSVSDVVLGGVR